MEVALPRNGRCWTWYDQAMSDYEADEYTNDELTKDYDEAN